MGLWIREFVIEGENEMAVEMTYVDVDKAAKIDLDEIMTFKYQFKQMLKPKYLGYLFDHKEVVGMSWYWQKKVTLRSTLGAL